MEHNYVTSGQDQEIKHYKPSRSPPCVAPFNRYPYAIFLAFFWTLCSQRLCTHMSGFFVHCCFWHSSKLLSEVMFSHFRCYSNICVNITSYLCFCHWTFGCFPLWVYSESCSYNILAHVLSRHAEQNTLTWNTFLIRFLSKSGNCWLTRYVYV